MTPPAERLWELDFAKITGPKASDAANFEELVGQILALELGAKAIDGSGGDLGIDCYVGNFGGELTAFQAKFFLGRLRQSQREQIKRSHTVAAGFHRLKRWVLCTPTNPTPDERKWFDSEFRDADWWGESKLRSLIVKYPGVAAQFFKEGALTARVASVEQRVERLRDELLVTVRPLGYNERRLVLAYLLDAERACCAALEDLRTWHFADDVPWVGIDFCELFAYLKTDPSLLVNRPLLDFCLGQSPWPVILPPGTVYEIGNFVQRSYFRLEAEEFLERLRQTIEAEAFVRQFEESATSRQTGAAYRAFIRRMRVCNVPDGPDAWRLAKALQSDRLSATPKEFRSVHSGLFTKVHNDFVAVCPPHRGPRSISADAANMAFLLRGEQVCRTPACMITSDNAYACVRDILDQGTLRVRTPRQFGTMLLAARPDSAGCERLQCALHGLEDLRKVAEHLFHQSTDSPDQWANCFSEVRRFADTYRDLLHPIDEMIVEGLQAIARNPSASLNSHESV